jgi:hypothetical protein
MSEEPAIYEKRPGRRDAYIDVVECKSCGAPEQYLEIECTKAGMFVSYYHLKCTLCDHEWDDRD